MNQLIMIQASVFTLVLSGILLFISSCVKKVERPYSNEMLADMEMRIKAQEELISTLIVNLKILNQHRIMRENIREIYRNSRRTNALVQQNASAQFNYRQSKDQFAEYILAL